ncbi:TPA: hypothetical protein EYP44_03855, partial [Candidatus Bathyarchaeota archaeon]|nr:hypothetical protein [Candidatus Bathyarchaeota archaeon]
TNRDQSMEATLRMAVKLIAKFPALVAAWHRIRNDKEPVEPLPDLSHAANFLNMLSGKLPPYEYPREKVLKAMRELKRLYPWLDGELARLCVS